MIMDGKLVRNEILENLKKQIIDEDLKLKLAIIYVGDDKPSEVYIKNKIKYAEKIGIETELITYDSFAKEEDIINCIKRLNDDDSVTGFILQSPVPKHINIENCIKYINPLKDIDGFTNQNFYFLSHDISGLRPCTSAGIIRLLDYYHIDLDGKKVSIIGRGNIVGKPLLFELLNRNATVSILHSKTKDIKEYTLNSDIVISACGKPNIITKDIIKDNSIVIDVGISVIDGKIVGDVDFENVKDKCLYITPNPGGVGPMTIAMIMENIVMAYKLQKKGKEE